MAKACLGIDWGTHSSKWCYQDGRRVVHSPDVWDSRVWRIGDCLALFPVDPEHHGEASHVEDRLKRTLIDDAGQSFWHGHRVRLGVSLGEAVVFSLYALLIDAMRTLQLKAIPLPARGELEIRFSHPNWISPESVRSLSHFRDAAVVATALVFDWGEASDADGGIQLRIDTLRRLLALTPRYQLPDFAADFEYDTYNACSQGAVRNIASWRLVFESSAAGFSYLVEDEPDTFRDGEPDLSADRWVRKLLVVDIGAGSADSGYMLRTIDRRDRKPLLIWLPAASALELAGAWLTNKIREDWRGQGKHASLREAEDYKTSGATDWYRKPFLKEWVTRVAEHVENYVIGIPDRHRLQTAPPLEIVITGGSSAVAPARQAIVAAVQRALQRRHVDPELAMETRLAAGDRASRLGKTTWAKRAVCIGASHPDLATLKHYAKGVG